MSVPLARPAPARVIGSDIAAAVIITAAVVIGMWVRHGGATAIAGGWADATTSFAQLSGLLAAGAGLAGLALVARPIALERRVGLDRLLVWHRYLGEAMALLVGAHVAAGLAEYAVVGGYVTALADLTGRQPYMATATVASLIIGIVTVSSLRSVRRRMAYETWYFVHLTAYAGLALSIPHQIVTGQDFADDPVARAAWIGLYAAVFALLLWGRVGRSVLAAARPLRVRSVTRLNQDTSEIVLYGGRLASMSGDAGQFVVVRPLRRGLWWQTHPFSLSAAPQCDEMRLSVKDRGDATRLITTLPVGTRVAVEGPYGTCTPSIASGRPMIFVAGGIGIAPVKAMLERLDPTSRPVVLYRAHRHADLVHLDELEQLCQARGGRVHTLVGPTTPLSGADPFSPGILRRAVPDLEQRVAVLCGPERLLVAARAGLRAAGLATADIHAERAWW